MSHTSEVARGFDKSSLRSNQKYQKNHQKYVTPQDSSQNGEDPDYQHNHSRSRNKKRKQPHSRPHKPQILPSTSNKKSKVIRNQKSEELSESENSSSSSSDQSSASNREMFTKRHNEIRQKFKREALPAESRSKQVLIEKPHASDPELQKSMEGILKNLAKEIRPKSMKNAYLLYDTHQGKAFSKDHFPFKQEEEINVKYLDSPFVAPSLRKKCFVEESSQITPKIEEFSLSFQQLPLRKVELKSSQARLQSFTEQSKIEEEAFQPEGVVEIVESSKPKKEKEMKLLSWIEQVNQESSTWKSDTPEPSPRAKLPMFFRKNVEQFLQTLGAVRP